MPSREGENPPVVRTFVSRDFMVRSPKILGLLEPRKTPNDSNELLMNINVNPYYDDQYSGHDSKHSSQKLLAPSR